MKVITVKTQAEFDAAVEGLSANDDVRTKIIIRSSADITIHTSVARGSAHVEARDSAHVEARDSAHVEAWNSAHVEARDSAHVEARNSAHVEAWDSAHVVAWNSAHVEARDSAHVDAWGSAHVEARDSAHVVACNSAHVEAWNSAHVEAWDSAHVEARDSAHVVAWDSAHVEAWNSAHVVAWGSAHVEARDSAHVVAWNSAHVEAWNSAHVEAWNSAHVVARENGIISVFSSTVKLSLKQHAIGICIGDECVILHQDQSATLVIKARFRHSIDTFFESYQYQVRDDSSAIQLYKSVNENGRDFYSNAITYKGVVTCPDWDPNPERQCGGGLHLSPTPALAMSYDKGTIKRCLVKKEDIVVYALDISKVRCRVVTVLDD